MSYILVARIDKVGVVRLNRPQALNALSTSLIEQLLEALQAFNGDNDVGAIVITGSDSVFCAGADIKELKELTFSYAYKNNFLQNLTNVMASIRKPIIGAVNGYALGGGCELAMGCDILYAGENASFGQPEVKVGTIPGAGGTQRLIRAIGKAKAMNMILTGESLNAREAEAAGLVAKVFPIDKVLDEAIAAAQKIATFSAPVIAMAKEAVNQAEETNLTAGLLFESRLYYAAFSLLDFKEGTSAFVEKRAPKWNNE